MIKSKKIDFNTEELDKLTNSQLKRVADYWLRQYLLKNAERNNSNYIFCPLKKRWYPESKIQASHYIDRNRNCTRYDLDNVHLISSQSNMYEAQIQVDGYKSKHHKEFAEYLGEKKVAELFAKSEKLCIFAQEDYIRIIETFRNG